MAVQRVVPFAVVVTVITLLSHTGMTSARSLATQRGALSQLLSKRNSWWSKKSVDAASDFTAIVPDTSLVSEDLVGISADANTELLVCYMSFCVPDFSICTASSRSADAFEVCRLQHRQCAARCLQLTRGDAALPFN